MYGPSVVMEWDQPQKKYTLPPGAIEIEGSNRLRISFAPTAETPLPLPDVSPVAIYMTATEAGGGLSSGGWAVIPSRTDGTRCVNGWESGGERSVTEAGQEIVLTEVHTHRSGYYTVDVTLFQAIIEQGWLKMKVTPLWVGGKDSVPPEKFLGAVNAAKAKAACYHCRHVHF